MPPRRTHDPLGEVLVPEHALWGAQTQRAIENFPISGARPHPAFVEAVVRIKRAAARTHRDSGRLDAARADAIGWAAEQVLHGRHGDQFVVDPYQAGAGTSHHMNVNEVLATLANQRLGVAADTAGAVHANDHVNMGQSTNDVIPTAIRLALLSLLPACSGATGAVIAALHERGAAFDGIVKAGRTHLQDAMPIRLGQEFAAWARSLERALARLRQAADWLLDLGIGGSAVGTGVNVEPGYPAAMVRALAADTGLPLREGRDRVQLMQSMGDVAAVHAALRGLAGELGRVCDDLRLLASGPRTGLGELRLPAVQPGSSIMPGKVNPSIVEMTNQVCLRVLGNDATVQAAADRGQLELNVMMPVIAHVALESLTLLTNAQRVLADRAIAGLEADAERAGWWVERSAALVTALAPAIGYERAAALAKQAVADGVTVRELVVRDGLLSSAEADRVLDLRRLTELGLPGAQP